MSFLAIEDEGARNLRTMPVCVRRKLAESGLGLGEEQWRELPLAARRRMVDMPADGSVERRSYASLVRWLCGTFLSPDAAQVGAGTTPWRDECPPAELGIEPACWRELGLDARFALVEALQQGRAREALRALTELTGGPVLLPTE